MDKLDKAMWVKTLWEPLEETEKDPLYSKREGIRVAAYCRVSPGNSNFSSLENQVNHYSEFIFKKENWIFVGVYIDDQKSGANIRNRPGFSRLLRHSQEGRIDLILTKNISRFSRNAKELLEVLEILKKSNTIVNFDAENISTSKETNSLIIGTYAAMAQDVIESDSNLVKFAYKRQVENGRPAYGYMYGYDPIEAKSKSMVKINEKEAEVVRFIFNEFIEGETYTSIARMLIDKGIKTKKGNEAWSSAYIKKILGQIAYTGNKKTGEITKDLFSGKVKKDDPRKDQYIISNNHPPIISSEIFEKVQEKIGANKTPIKKYNRTVKYSLSKRMVCGLCQKTIIKIGHYNYRCPTSYASTELCELEKIKIFQPQNMAIKVLFKRILNCEVNTFKDKKGIHYEIKDPLGRSGKELEDDFQKMLKTLQGILEKINKNDHFEFQRLKFFTEIEIAKKQNLLEKAEEIKQEYKLFDEEVSRIEEDREYRDKALEWIKTIRNIEDFILTSTIDILRAWILSFKIYSLNAYIIEWIDGTTTTIGEEEIPLIIEATEEKRAAREEQIASQNLLNPSRIYLKTEIIENKSPGENLAKKVLMTKRKEDLILEMLSDVKENLEIDKIQPTNKVVKLEHGLTIRDLSDLKKNILKNTMNNLKEEKTKSKLKVAAYCRVSTLLEEQQISFQTQLAYYNFKILSNPSWEFAGIYADEGLSGTNAAKRDDFNKMIKDAKAGKINMIITKSISRFSRNIVEVLETMKTLNELEPPVFCYFEKERIFSNDPKSITMFNLIATAAEEESISISNSITWGVQNLAKRGIISRITDIYGYSIDKKRNWTIVDKEADAIRTMYKMYSEDKSINQIIEHLKEKDIVSPTGLEYWDYNTIRQILSSEKYIGDYKFQKSYTPDSVGSKTKVNTGQRPMYYIEDHHDPIVDKKLYKKVQKRLDKRKRIISKDDKKDGTAGRQCYYQLFYCDECGELISRYKSSTYDSKEGSHWRCVNSYKQTGSTCNIKTMFLEKYLDYNFTLTLSEIKESKKFRRLMNSHFKRLQLKPKDMRHKKEIEEKIENLSLKLYAAVDTELQKDGKDTELIDRLTSEILSLREELKNYLQQLEDLESDEKRLKDLIKYCERINPIKFRDFHNMRPRINKGDSIYSTTNNARNSTYVEEDGEDHFPEEVFINQVISCRISEEGYMKYKFAEGIEFGIDMTYEEYKEEFQNERAKIEFEELLNSSETLGIREFCKEGKKPKEIRTHLGIESRVSFDKRILKPLYGAGKLKLKRGTGNNHWWYSWNYENEEE